ncbi:MAG: hypothetical protein L0220_19430 [Acidobacteria bacterium]|nr:hypothetical protein [Acidobacteriota bacterium]
MRRRYFLLWALLVTIAGLSVSYAAIKQVTRKRVVFDLDLTRGPSVLPPGVTVAGGIWDQGWRVTANEQRIVIDAGYPLRNGLLEVALTRKEAPLVADQINFIGIFEKSAIAISDRGGDALIFRAGRAESQLGVQGTIMAFTGEQSERRAGAIWEDRIGSSGDWKIDDKTPAALKFEWRNGSSALTEINGNVLKCKNDCNGTLNSLRYVVLGSDRSEGEASLIGARFLKVRLTDLDVSSEEQ